MISVIEERNSNQVCIISDGAMNVCMWVWQGLKHNT